MPPGSAGRGQPLVIKVKFEEAVIKRHFKNVLNNYE
jgi:hypothetical protein